MADPSIVVCVTGAAGFVGAHICKALLDRGGFRVRGCVRSQRPEKVQHLLKLGTPENRIELHTADLLVEGSFDEAFQGSFWLFLPCNTFNHQNFQSNIIWNRFLKRIYALSHDISALKLSGKPNFSQVRTTCVGLFPKHPHMSGKISIETPFQFKAKYLCHFFVFQACFFCLFWSYTAYRRNIRMGPFFDSNSRITYSG